MMNMKKISIAIVATMAPVLACAAAAPKPPKIPAMPTFGVYSEKPSDDVLQKCNTTVSDGGLRTVFDVQVPTFNVHIEDDEDTTDLSCVPRVTTYEDSQGNEHVKLISTTKALCSAEGLLAEVNYNKTTLTYGGNYIEVVDGIGTGITENFKSVMKLDKTCAK